MGAVNTTYTFTATDTITSTKMNNIIDQTTITSDAVFAGGTIEVVSGKLRVAAGKITSNELASNSVNTDEIVNSAVTTAKLANSTSTTTGVTNAKIANNAVTEAKIADSSITSNKIVNGDVTAPKLSGAQTGTAPIYGIRAFASFNGAAASPITTIVEGNIGTITRTATGVYLVTFTTSMPSANYTIMANARYLDFNTFEANCWFTSVTASSFVLNVAGGGGNYNSERIDLMVLA